MNRATWDLLEGYMLSCMKDSAHDAQHVYRVLYGALEIAQDETDVNMDVLIAACLLHDISRSDQMADPRICHALHGGDKARDFLLANGFDAAFAEHVRQCIRTHRFRRSDPPATAEARILFDADKLDVTGALGVARTLCYNGAAGEPIYSLLPDGNVSDGSREEPDSFFREYRFKLEGVYDRFLTTRGAALAQERKAAAATFYAQLLEEADSLVRNGRSVLHDVLAADED